MIISELLLATLVGTTIYFLVRRTHFRRTHYWVSLVGYILAFFIIVAIVFALGYFWHMCESDIPTYYM